MRSIIIPASKSLTVSNKFPDKNIDDDTIIIGYDGKFNYLSFLTFDFSSIPDHIVNVNAELVLFKCNNFYNDPDTFFDIYPLSDYFSSYTTYNNPPSIKRITRKILYPFTTKVAVTANITNLVMLWITNAIPNKGLIISGKGSKSTATFGSSKCNDKYLVPFIKITFDTIINQKNCKEKELPEKCHQHPKDNRNEFETFYNGSAQFATYDLWKIHYTETVPSRSIMVIIFEVIVTRSSGNKDYYYVSDEFDNSAGNEPMNIAKTYVLVITPKMAAGDTTEQNYYYSFIG